MEDEVGVAAPIDEKAHLLESDEPSSGHLPAHYNSRPSRSFRVRVSGIALALSALFLVLLFPDERIVCTHTYDIEQLKMAKYASDPSSATGPSPKVAILVLYDSRRPAFAGRNATMLQLSLENKRHYAEMHGYTMIDASGTVDRSRPTAWSKLLALRAHLTKFDYIAWFDIDTLIMNPCFRLEWFLPQPPDTVWDLAVTQDYSGVNTGVFIIRNSTFSSWLLDKWWGLDFLVKGNYLFEYEQRGIHYLLNTPTWTAAGMPRYPGREDIAGHLTTLPQCAFNSYYIPVFPPTKYTFWSVMWGYYTTGQYVDGDFVVHFAGHKGDRKLSLFLEYHSKSVKYFADINECLVPPLILLQS